MSKKQEAKNKSNYKKKMATEVAEDTENFDRIDRMNLTTQYTNTKR